MPVPVTKDRYVVQFINESNQTLLLAANAAHVAGKPPKPVMPRENTWVMGPYDPNHPGNLQNVLTIDIPVEWEGTIPEGSLGPVLWVRTGCHYDIATNTAQCETGGCGGPYDCSAAGRTATGPKALTIMLLRISVWWTA